MAKVYSRFLKKGQKYYLEGKLETSKYEVAGQPHYLTKIKIEYLEF
jgi:single-stranded DNA-binding protein